MAKDAAITIYLPPGLLKQAMEAKGEQETLDHLVADALEREVRRRRGLRAYDEIARLREDILREHGVQPDSTPLIRALRDGEGRRD